MAFIAFMRQKSNVDQPNIMGVTLGYLITDCFAAFFNNGVGCSWELFFITCLLRVELHGY